MKDKASAIIDRVEEGEAITVTKRGRPVAQIVSATIPPQQGFYVHAVSERLLAQAAKSARAHSLRAYDAVHLAGALSFAAGEGLDFACWDKELRQAAHNHGFMLVPPTL